MGPLFPNAGWGGLPNGVWGCKFTPSFGPSSESTAIALRHNQNACLASIDRVIVALQPTQSFLVIGGLVGTSDPRVAGSIPVGRTIQISDSRFFLFSVFQATSCFSAYSNSQIGYTPLLCFHLNVVRGKV